MSWVIDVKVWSLGTVRQGGASPAVSSRRGAQ
jgi:hypothetical protein